MSANGVTVIRGPAGELVAVSGETHVWFAREIAVLEREHPRRRFALMLALVGRLMQTGPEPEAYDANRAAFYARYILIPDRTFIVLRDEATDAELAESFNVPLEQITAKHIDIATGGCAHDDPDRAR